MLVRTAVKPKTKAPIDYKVQVSEVIVYSLDITASSIDELNQILKERLRESDMELVDFEGYTVDSVEISKINVK